MADETIHELKIIQSEEVKKNDEMWTDLRHEEHHQVHRCPCKGSPKRRIKKSEQKKIWQIDDISQI
jgi:hypothetical protein